jgi:hypothetical protein
MRRAHRRRQQHEPGWRGSRRQQHELQLQQKPELELAQVIEARSRATNKQLGAGITPRRVELV